MGLDVTDLDSVELPVLSSRSVTREADFGSYLLQNEIVWSRQITGRRMGTKNGAALPRLRFQEDG